MAQGNWREAGFALPIFALLGIISAIYFLLNNHPSGLAIYMNRMLDQPGLFMAVGLHIWAGMLLQQSRIPDLFMNILRPWNLSPETLTYILILLAAVPTAYIGVSGLFVIAAGGLIYHEVRNAGATRQYAMAATAMSGSTGVVLYPCLLIVAITALNKEVTSSELYHWGFYVFLLTTTLFYLFSQMHRHNRGRDIKVTSPAVAIPLMLKEAKAILPLALMMAAIILFYRWVLDTRVSDTTITVIMPVALISILLLDKWLERRQSNVVKPSYAAHRQSKFEGSMRVAAADSSIHSGSLLSIMLMSLAVAGVVERSEIMNHAPQVFSNVWMAMTFLVVVKVILGMFMDPFGAIILVSGTLAPIAYNNGIDPVHFWMMVLVAFELGYLMPPIALNQLLARQVIGVEEANLADSEVKKLNFYRRYQRWIQPTIVMAVALSVVAYLPLAVKEFEFLAPLRQWLTFVPQ